MFHQLRLFSLYTIETFCLSRNWEIPLVLFWQILVRAECVPGKHSDHNFYFFGKKWENEKCLELPDFFKFSDLARKLIRKTLWNFKEGWTSNCWDFSLLIIEVIFHWRSSLFEIFIKLFNWASVSNLRKIWPDVAEIFYFDIWGSSSSLDQARIRSAKSETDSIRSAGFWTW